MSVKPVSPINNPDSRPRRSKQGLVLASLLLALLIIAVWWYRSTMMELVLRQYLERASVSASKLSGLQFNFDQAHLSELEFGVETGAGRLSAKLEDIRTDYDLSVPKVEAILVGHAHLKFAYQSQPKDRPRTADQNAPNTVALPLERLSVEQLDIDIETPWGLSHFFGRGEMRRGDDNSIEASFLDSGQSVRFKFGPPA